MNTVEKITAELYEALLHLRYPGIAQVTPQDMEKTILGSDNRLFLLSWLLSQSPLVSAQEFATNADAAKLLKWYTNMGICVSVDASLGKVPMQNQIDTLKNLLLFVKNVLMVDDVKSCEETSFVDLLKKHIGGSVNIIPPTCSLTSKLNYNEAIRYLNSTKEVQVPSQKTQPSNEIFCTNGSHNTAAILEHDHEKVVEKFVESFESVSTWPQLKNERSTPPFWNSMNNHVESVHSNMNMLKETLHSKDAISSFAIADRLTKHEMPLDDIIEDIVIRLEEVNNQHTEE